MDRHDVLQGLGDRHDVGPARGRPLIAVTETAATILAPSGANLTYGRHNKPAPGPLGDRIGANYMSGARSSNKGARTGRAMSAATEIAKGTA
jgi:hypothetical protein